MIYDILPVNTYLGNNNTTTFEFDFYIENENQLKVYLYDENDIKYELKHNIDYKIHEFKNNNGSYITFPIQGSNYKVLNDKQQISLELELAVCQPTQYNNSSLLNLKALEYSFDYLTRIIQILKRKISLCVKVEECSTQTPEELIDSINNAQRMTKENAQIAQESTSIVTNGIELNKQYLEKIEKLKGELLESNSFKFQLFDTIIKDCKLEKGQSTGWSEVGTTVLGEIYTDFYNKCIEEKENSLVETIELNGQTISVYKNSNGHIYYDEKDKNIIEQYYNLTGEAWFYGINTEQKYIILPKKKFFKYEENTKLQTENTNIHMYICIGNNIVNNESIDFGQIINEINKLSNLKLDKSLIKAYITETYVNNQSGYVVYSNGYCEQWGWFVANTSVDETITLLKKYRDNNYNITMSQVTKGIPKGDYVKLQVFNIKTDRFDLYFQYSTLGACWRTCGYLAEGEY